MGPTSRTVTAAALLVAITGTGYGVLRWRRERALREMLEAQASRPRATCVDTPEFVRDDAVTDLGTPAELLAVASRTHEASVWWRRKLEVVEQPAMGTSTRLTLSFERKGPVRLVRSKPYYPPDLREEMALLCSDRLALEVRVHLRTADGLFDERFDGSLAFMSTSFVAPQSGPSVLLSRRQALEALKGSFRITQRKPSDLNADHVLFELELSSNGPLRGFIGGTYDAVDGDTAWGSMVRFACFPDERGCR